MGRTSDVRTRWFQLAAGHLANHDDLEGALSRDDPVAALVASRVLVTEVLGSEAVSL
jgi:hypothetical protein